MKKYSRFNCLCVLSSRTRALFSGVALPAAKTAAGSGLRRPKPTTKHEWPEDWAGSINYLDSDEFRNAVNDRKCPLEQCLKAYRWPFRSSVIALLDNALMIKDVRDYARRNPSFLALMQVGTDWLGYEDNVAMSKEVVKYQREYMYRGKFPWISKRGVDMALDELTRTARWFYSKHRDVPAACRRRFTLLILHMRRIYGV